VRLAEFCRRSRSHEGIEGRRAAPRLLDVEPDEAHRIGGVRLVVGAEPCEQVAHGGVAPDDQQRSRRLLRRAGAGADVLFRDARLEPRSLHRHDAETELLHHVADQASLGLVVAAGGVGALAEPDDGRVADDLRERREVGVVERRRDAGDDMDARGDLGERRDLLLDGRRRFDGRLGAAGAKAKHRDGSHDANRQLHRAFYQRCRPKRKRHRSLYGSAKIRVGPSTALATGLPSFECLFH
jgi:hypothetical protein